MVALQISAHKRGSQIEGFEFAERQEFHNLIGHLKFEFPGQPNTTIRQSSQCVTDKVSLAKLLPDVDTVWIVLDCSLI